MQTYQHKHVNKYHTGFKTELTQVHIMPKWLYYGQTTQLYPIHLKFIQYANKKQK